MMKNILDNRRTFCFTIVCSNLRASKLFAEEETSQAGFQVLSRDVTVLHRIAKSLRGCNNFCGTVIRWGTFSSLQKTKSPRYQPRPATSTSQTRNSIVPKTVQKKFPPTIDDGHCHRASKVFEAIVLSLREERNGLVGRLNLIVKFTIVCIFFNLTLIMKTNFA